jgi:hypothetical protein
MVQVNAVLQAAIQNPNTVAVSWEDLIGSITGRMSRSYQMTFSGVKTVAQKGKLNPIDIQVGRRTGNKKVRTNTCYICNMIQIYNLIMQWKLLKCLGTLY